MLTDHTADVVGVALHPTNKYFITASADKTWAFYDLESMLCMAQVNLLGSPVLWHLLITLVCMFHEALLGSRFTAVAAYNSMDAHEALLGSSLVAIAGFNGMDVFEAFWTQCSCILSTF